MKILLIAASGIGNTILATPMMRILKRSLPDSEVVFLSLNKSIENLKNKQDIVKQSFNQVVDKSDFIDRIIPTNKYLGYKGFFQLIKDLRKEKFDYSFTLFPSNKWQFNLFARLVKASSKVTHSYTKFLDLKNLAWLQNRKIKANNQIHDIEQNIHLLKIMDLNTQAQTRKMYFNVSNDSKIWAGKYFQKFSGKRVIGFHPGSSVVNNFTSKRWSAENFARLAKILISKQAAKIIVFLGPDEKDLKKYFKGLEQTGDLIIFEDSLDTSAALMERCNLFVSNDSGLMHIAAALDVKTIGLFGPTNWQRTSPFGVKTKIIRLKNMSCSPCFDYPFKSSNAKVECKKINCLEQITPEFVYSEIIESELWD